MPRPLSSLPSVIGVPPSDLIAAASTGLVIDTSSFVATPNAVLSSFIAQGMDGTSTAFPIGANSTSSQATLRLDASATEMGNAPTISSTSGAENSATVVGARSSSSHNGFLLTDSASGGSGHAAISQTGSAQAVKSSQSGSSVPSISQSQSSSASSRLGHSDNKKLLAAVCTFMFCSSIMILV